ncbi:HD domain-containing protein [Clostridium diolis]|uniref:HD-CE domain-containing protein n=1 Tax=Clostridium diolis TaxID=223919 RepID=A0AAV3VZE8_9CLOT|nr:ATP-binding protein [Clostridium diolis]QES71973.1 hypothetical protein F3K33_03790 [Clostridium diolis]GEA30901.1 hypothetical protein CDIOL_18240 [Clostridium diolis]
MLSIYTLEKHLLLCGDEDQKYKVLYDIYNFNKTLICDVINETDRYFSFYSRHDATHSETIISSIEALLGESGIKQLSPTDTFLLLLSAYLHDFGMCLQYKEIKEMLKTGDFNDFVREKSKEKAFKQYTYWVKDDSFKTQFFHEINWPLDAIQSINILISEYYRKSHGDKSEGTINEQFKNSNININPHKHLPERLEILLGRICSLHTKDFSLVMDLDHETNGAFNDKAHPRFIAILIRLGDLLDLDNNRFDEIKLATICDEIPALSKIHYEKHKSIKSFLITPKTINIVSESDDDTVLREMRSWVKWIQEEVDNFGDNWSRIVPNNFLGTIPNLQHNIKKSNGEIIFADKDLKISLPEQKAFQIIQGTNIYKHNLIFIREYIQNAIDALKIQFLLDQFQELDNFNMEERFETENDKIKYICEKYYKDDLDDVIKKYGVTIRIYDCRNKEELEAFRYYYNCKNYKEEDFYSKIIVVIEDNGTGISIDDITNRILKVGKKDKKNDDEYKKLTEKMPAFLQPTGTFGIGLHSGFLATDKIIIHTKTSYDKNNGREIIIESGTKTGFVQCNIWNKEEEKLNTIMRGTQFIMSLDVECIKVDEQYTTPSYQCEFPFGKSKRDYLIDYIVGITKAVIRHPFFNVKLVDYNKNTIATTKRNIIDSDVAEKSIVKETIIKNNKKYNVKVSTLRSSDRNWYLTVEERKDGNVLVLKLGDKWDKNKKVNILYKGIQMQSIELQEILKRYIICGSEAIINYSFKETSDYITINRDEVTKEGRDVCEAIFEELMYIGLEHIKTYFMKEYGESTDIKGYIKARRIFETISEEFNTQFSKFIENTKDEINDKEFEFNYNDDLSGEIRELLTNNKVEILLEAFVKILASKMLDTRKHYEEYELQEKINKYKELFYIAVSKFLLRFSSSVISDEFFSKDYIECLFDTLSIEIGGHALSFLETNKLLPLIPSYKSRDGKIKTIELNFKTDIPALGIFLYHIKYAQSDLLDERYRNILEVLADNYIYNSNYGSYSQSEDNAFEDIFLYRIIADRMKPIRFGAEAICNYNQLYLPNNEFFHDEKGNCISIYPIKNMKIKYKKQNNKIIESKYYVQLNCEKGNLLEYIFIECDFQVIKEYMFSDIIEYNYIDVEQIGTCYFKERNMYCMPATKNYYDIAVKNIPFEFQKCYKESKFKYIKQDNYIMIPVDKNVVMRWGDLFEGSHSTEFKTLAMECRKQLIRGNLLTDIEKHLMDNELYEWNYFEEIYIEHKIDIYKLFINDCKKIKMTESFLDIVNYTLKNRSYQTDVAEEEIREKIVNGYILLLKDIFIHIIDFFYK